MTEIYCPGCKGARFPALSSRNCPDCAKLRKEKNKTIHNRNWQEKGKKKYYKDLVSSGKASYIFQKPKIKYLYPLDKQTESLCKNLAKPYIKDIANIV